MSIKNLFNLNDYSLFCKDLSISGNLSIGKNVDINGNLDINGNINLDNNLNIQGNLTVNEITANVVDTKILRYEELDPEIVPAQTYSMEGPPNQNFGNVPDWYIDKKTNKNYKKLLIPVEVLNFPVFTGSQFNATNEATFDSALSSAQSGDIINIMNNISFTSISSKVIGNRNILIRSDPVSNNKYTISSATQTTSMFASTGSLCMSKLNITHNIVSTGAQNIINVSPSLTQPNNGWLPYCFHDITFTISEFGMYGSPVQDVQFTNCNFLYNGLSVNNNHSFLFFTGMKNVCVDNCNFTNSNDLATGRSRWITVSPSGPSSGFNSIRGSLRLSNTTDITNNANGIGRQAFIYESALLGTGISNTSLFVFNNVFKQFSGGVGILFGNQLLNNFKDIIIYNNTYSNLTQQKGLIALDNGSGSSSTGLLQGQLYTDNTNIAGDISTYFSTYESLITLDTTLTQEAFQITYNTAIFTAVASVMTPNDLEDGSNWIYNYIPLGREILQSGSGSGVSRPLIISNLNNTNYNWFELTLFYAPSIFSSISWDFSTDNGATFTTTAEVSSATLRGGIDNWQVWARGSGSILPFTINGNLNANWGCQIKFKWARPIFNTVSDFVNLDFETNQNTSAVGVQLVKGTISTSNILMPTNFRFTNASGTGTISYQYQVVGYNLPQ